MKANEMVCEVRKTETALAREIAGTVQKYIDELVEKTGLEIDRVSVEFADITSLKDFGRKSVVSRINIDHSLPGGHV